ncbi:MAG: two-partner secretion domain-containing protein [Thainema sp.]
MLLSFQTLGITVCSGFIATSFLIQSAALGQITPDDTLGAESSEVVPTTLPPFGDGDLILGGAARGANLFHSFSEFNVAAGEFVGFENPPGIERIFSRVTGNTASEILGILTVGGNADLFLLNPNGILFGPNSATVLIGGSLFATTADGFLFDNNQLFNARNPSPVPLLTINTPVGLQYGNQRPGDIRAQSGILGVNQSQSLILAGGNVLLENSSVGLTPDSNIGFPSGSAGKLQIAAINDAGIIGITVDGDLVGLDFANDLNRADISIQDSAIDVRAEARSSLAFSAHNMNILDSSIVAGIDTDSGFEDAQALDMVLDASDEVNITSSVVRNIVDTNAVGNAGNLIIETSRLNVLNSSELATSTFGMGNAGDIIIKASEVLLDDVDSIGTNTIRSTVEETGQGLGGSIQINADSLELRNGSQIDSSVLGIGDAGNLFLEISGSVLLDGTSPNGESGSGLGSTVALGAQGNGGSVELTANSLTVTNGAQINASTFGDGNVGDVIVTVDDSVLLDGTSPNGSSASGLGGTISPEAQGNGGNVELTANSLTVTNGAQINVSTFGDGNAGNVTVTVNDFVRFSGTSPNGRFLSVLGSAVNPGAQGNGGSIEITADSLTVANGAQIGATTSGDGNAGNVIVTVDDFVLLDGTSPNREIISGLGSTVNQSAQGAGGEIEITANSLTVTNGAQVTASTEGKGNAGNITVTVGDSVLLNGTNPNGESVSGLGSAVNPEAQGNGGSVELIAEFLVVTNGAQIVASTFGNGSAGEVTVIVDDSVRLDGIGSNGKFRSGLFSTVETNAMGDGGNVELIAGSLEATNGAVINTSTFGDGNAGKIIVEIDDSVRLDGTTPNGILGSGLSSTVNQNAQGNGGSVELAANSLFISSEAEIAVTSESQGSAGDVTLQMVENIELEQGLILSNSASLLSERGGNISIDSSSLNMGNGSAILAETFNSQGGNIAVDLDSNLIMRNGSLVSTTAGTAQAGGDGGNIDITADFIIGVPQENSDIAADAFEGDGGQVNITALDIFGLEFRDQRTPLSDITASSEGGAAGITTFNQLTSVDVRQGLTELPENIVDPTGLIDRSCDVASAPESEFIITGRGGLPPEPSDRLNDNQFLDDLGPETMQTTAIQSSHQLSENEQNDRPDVIQEAQGWIVNEAGQVQLIAAAPGASYERSAIAPCP